MTDFDKYILYPFLGNIAKSADRNAFCINGKFYTYREFGRAVSRIQLSVAEAGSNSRNVGLVINDDLETYASIFALWLEGGELRASPSRLAAGALPRYRRAVGNGSHSRLLGKNPL